jgi:hypothetical protein
MRKERSATAATIVFDGTTLVNGAANFHFPRLHPSRYGEVAQAPPGAHQVD